MRKTITAPRINLAFGSLSFLLGFAFIAGGPARASSISYSVITQSGGPYVWGTVLVVIGTALILSVGQPALMRPLLLAGAIAHGILAGAFLVSALTYAEANLTAVVAYGGYSAFHLCAFYRSRRPAVEPHDTRRVAALRELLREVKSNDLRVRADDDPADACTYALARATSILFDERYN